MGSKFVWGAKIASLVLLTSVALFLWPFFDNVTSSGISLMYGGDASFGMALQNSVFFAAFSSLAVVGGGLVLALQLSSIEPGNRWSKLLPVLLLPSVLGNVSTAFVWKLQLLDNSYFFQSSARNFLALLLIQGWQYGMLFCYLFWLQIKEIKKDRMSYCKMARLSRSEMVKDLYLPQLKNLSILLLMLQFLFSFYEDAKIQFIFKASRGTNAEMITNWFKRTYQSGSLINTKFAFQQITASGVITIIVIATLLGALSIVANWAFTKYTGNRIFTIASKRFLSDKTWVVILCALIFTPIISNFIRYYNFTPHSFEMLTTTILYTFVGALLATGFAVLFSMFARLGWRNSLYGFQRKAIPWIIGIFLLGLIPPVALLASGYDWIRLVGYRSPFSLDLVWILGQIIVAFPLLGSFTLFTYFQVKNHDILYMQIHRADFSEISKELFIRPFHGNYLLTFIIAFALVFNEPILNSILSDRIPSFTSQIQKVITGRTVDYSRGMEYLFVSLILAVSAVVVWSHLFNKKLAR